MIPVVDCGVAEEIVDPSYYASIDEELQTVERNPMAKDKLLAALGI